MKKSLFLFLKKKKKNPITNIFTIYFILNTVDAPLATITASNRCQHDVTSLAHPSGMGRLVHRQFSDVSRDVHMDPGLGTGWATQGRLQSCLKATPLEAWLCVCPAERLTAYPVNGQNQGGLPCAFC